MTENSLKGVENTVGKEKLLHYEQFLLSHSVSKRIVLQTHKTQGLFGEGLKVWWNKYLSLCIAVRPN